jgi:hypothetical protein
MLEGCTDKEGVEKLILYVRYIKNNGVSQEFAEKTRRF